MDCVFCKRIAEGDVDRESELAVSFGDAFPVSKGHSLVVPRMHVGDIFDLDQASFEAVWSLVRQVKQERVGAEGFNVGVNVGAAGGQTVAHAHVHVIPRAAGDVPDPRGGIRWVLPNRAVYWKS